MAKFYGVEKISNFVKVNNSIARLSSGSFVKLGGQAYDIGQLDLDTNTIGIGGMEVAKQANTFYYVYLVRVSGVNYLIATTSNQNISGYNSQRKIGAFFLNDTSEVFFAKTFGSGIGTDPVKYDPEDFGMSVGVVSDEFYYKLSPAGIHVWGNGGIPTNNTNTAYLTLPGLQIDNVSMDNLTTFGCFTRDAASASTNDFRFRVNSANRRFAYLCQVNSGGVSGLNLLAWNGVLNSGQNFSFWFHCPVQGLPSIIDWNLY